MFIRKKKYAKRMSQIVIWQRLVMLTYTNIVNVNKMQLVTLTFKFFFSKKNKRLLIMPFRLQKKKKQIIS